MDGRRPQGCAQPGAPGSLPRLCPGGRRWHLSNNNGSMLPHGTAHGGRGKARAKVVDGDTGFRGDDITMHMNSDAISAETRAENSHCLLTHMNLLNTLQAAFTQSPPHQQALRACELQLLNSLKETSIYNETRTVP